MAQGLRELIGRAMIDPEFMADLQRSPDTVLAQFQLKADESTAVRQALLHLAQTPPHKRARELHTALTGRLRERKLRKGQVLFREGDEGEEMFLVREGAILVSKGVTGKVEQVLARFGPGDFFGEMSLFDRSPRSATIQAETDTLLLALDRENLNGLMQVNPRAAAAFFYGLVQVFIERLRTSGELVAEITRWGLEATGLDMESR